MEKKSLDIKNIFILFIILYFSSLIFVKIYSVKKNTLYNNRNWICTKTKTEKYLIGAHQFWISTQSLFRERLNLSCWHGFQEIIYKKQLEPVSITFDFFLERNSYLSFIFNKNEKQFSGIRLSVNPKFDNIYFNALNSGKIIFKKKINIKIKPKKWNKCKVEFVNVFINSNLPYKVYAKKIKVFINNENVGEFFINLINNQYIGFRGSYKPCYIDNIKIKNITGKIVLENFDYKRNRNLIFWTCFIILICLNLICFILSKFFIKVKQIGINNFILINIVILVLSIVLFIFYSQYYLKRYPVLNKNLFEKEFVWKNLTADSMCNEISRKYKYDKHDKYRILFLGGSQTWGAGVFKKEHIFTELLEKKFKNKNKKIECINAGISGIKLEKILKIYKKDWIRFQPDIVFLNVSNNDIDTKDILFEENLKDIILINKKNNIKTIFVLEANSIETESKIDIKHDIMRKTAVEYGIKIIDMHSFLLKNYDKGFIWWDQVHLTSFGNELFAEYLYEMCDL